MNHKTRKAPKVLMIVSVFVISMLLLTACGRQASSPGAESSTDTEAEIIAEDKGLADANIKATAEVAEAEDAATEEAQGEGTDAVEEPENAPISANEVISETDELVEETPVADAQAATAETEKTEEEIEADDDQGVDGPDTELSINVDENAALGAILVDAGGMTLYISDSDTNGKSSCTGACLEKWLPMVVDNADQVLASNEITGEFDTIEAADDMLQVTVNGHPLYYFAGDEKPGDVTGQAVDESWWAVTANGEPAKP